MNDFPITIQNGFSDFGNNTCDDDDDEDVVSLDLKNDDDFSDDDDSKDNKKKTKKSPSFNQNQPEFDINVFTTNASHCLGQTWDLIKGLGFSLFNRCNGSLLKTATINAYRSWPLFGIFVLLFFIFFICTLSTINVDFDGTELQNAANVASAIRKGLVLTFFDVFFLSSIISMVSYEYMIMHNSNRDMLSDSEENNF